jgi:phosphatidylglycerol:prolipoprotein diacylglycerol transferase
MLIFAVPAALVGLRAYYVIFYLDLYRREDGSLDWGSIFRITDGGLAIYGGIIACAITLLIFCRVRKISFLAFADLGVHGLLIGQCIGRWGNFMNVEAYGSVTTLPWRMCSQSIANELWYKGLLDSQEAYQAILDGTLGVHPTFLYESLWNFVGIFLIYFLGKYARKFDGQLCLTYFLWYGIGRTWIEGLRTDSLYFFGLELFGVPVRTSQVLALLSAAAAGVILVWQLTRKYEASRLYVNRIAASAPKEVTAELQEEPVQPQLEQEQMRGEQVQKQEKPKAEDQPSEKTDLT